MTVRQWLELLIIPLVLSLVTVVFTWQQSASQQAIEDERAVRAREAEDRRAEVDRQIEEQRARDAALQAYLDQMSTLLLEKDLNDEKVQTLMRARTITVLTRLGSDGKTQVMRFLAEADLVQGVDEEDPVIRLEEADLRGANLSYANLEGANLVGADLSYANLRGVKLGDAKLVGADVISANLNNADLSSADLEVANLSFADLSYSDMSETRLFFADLSYADLYSADGTTNEDVGVADSLEGAIMPDGQLYPGEHATDEFEPAFRFEVGEGWGRTSLVPETSSTMSITTEAEGGQLTFGRPQHVFHPSNPSEPEEVPAPDNPDEWVSWFESHPNLDASKPVPASVGGVSGVRIDVTARSAPDNYSQEYCVDRPCVPLFPLGDLGMVSLVNLKDRFVIVEVDGETVVVNVFAPADKFDAFLPKAQKVLDTVEWEGTQAP